MVTDASEIKPINPKTRDVIFGSMQTFALLFLDAVAYNAVFIEWVRDGEWTFLGDFWFFLVVLLFFPVINTALLVVDLFRKKWFRPLLLAGNLLGVVLYATVGCGLMAIVGF